MWLSAQSIFTFLNAEVWPLLRGENPANSFPFVQFAFQAFTIGTIWLAAVVLYWTWRFSGPRMAAASATRQSAEAPEGGVKCQVQ